MRAPTHPSRPWGRPLLALALAASLGAAASPGWATESGPSGGYQVPPAPLPQLLDATTPPSVLLNAQNTAWVQLSVPATQRLADVAAPKKGLGGFMVWPAAHSTATPGRFDKVEVALYPSMAFKAVRGLPAGARWDSPSWSPDGSRLVMVERGTSGCWLWEVNPRSASARRLSPRRLNATVTKPYHWLADGSLVISLVPSRMWPMPQPLAVPGGPVVSEADGQRRPTRTDPTLLKDSQDEALLSFLLWAQLAVLKPNGLLREVGGPTWVVGFEPSPDAKHLLVERVSPPFSRQVSIDRFAGDAAIWSLSTGRVEKLVDAHPTFEAVPTDFDAEVPGKRQIRWRPNADATLVWHEALDGGDPKKPAVNGHRDALWQWAAPWNQAPKQRLSVAGRIQSITWAEGQMASLQEGWWKTRNDRRWWFAPDGDKPLDKPWLNRSSEDAYADPGEFVTQTNARGRQVMRFSPQGEVFLMGEGASPEGDRPFLRRVKPATGESLELFRSSGAVYEDPWRILDERGEKLLTRQESPNQPPTYGLRLIGQAGFQPLQRVAHPQPELLGVQKRLIRYKRADGLPLSGTLYLPKGWKPEHGRLPVLMWAYPAEFKTADAAGQVSGSPHHFTMVRGVSPLHFVARGFAVLDDPTLPILGEGDREPNDTYVQQLRAGAEAAVKAVVDEGVADPARIAVGGHSYGAFMTANLLAHTRLFAAGIARSGAYNRTLTPFGFQSEERSFWQAPDIYAAMSPFNNAQLIESPLLMIHGQADTNSGTFPIQSERLFQALKGLGKRAKLVMLPAEDHGYRARESLLHVLAESDAWLQRWVVTPPDRRR